MLEFPIQIYHLMIDGLNEQLRSTVEGLVSDFVMGLWENKDPVGLKRGLMRKVLQIRGIL